MKGSQRNLQLIIREYLLMLRPGYIFLIYILQAPSNIRVSLSKSLEIQSSEAFQHPQRCKNQWKSWFSRGCGNGSAIPKLSLARAWKNCGKNRPGALPVWKFAGVWCTSLFLGELGRDISSQVRVFPVGYLEFRMEFTPKGSLFKVS